ncbi:MAG: HD domain-containing phosphohydrolase [Candidatus Susulua stagnicola]|nr:HD domain-containing phosphohydrolase [Candidatus Susulua stagnicola]
MTYKTVFSSLHTIYRLTTTSSSLVSFAIGVSRLFRNLLKANKIVIICNNGAPQTFLKVRLENKKQFIKKGGKSILTRIEKEILKQEKEMSFGRRLIYPFIFNETLGAIYIKRDSGLKPYNEAEKGWFSALCEEVSVSLKVINLHREQQKLMLNYINSLTKFLNQYVPTSSLHTKPMLRLIRAMGKSMHLSEIETKALVNASLLHDAGKMQVPSNLLEKQKPLTNEEFKVMAKHPRKGVELLKNLEILKPAIPIILHHHERYDGQGYPSKLKKDKIPLGSRILSILDSFDAMFFGRPYRKRKPLEEIEQEIKKQKGKQFDPKIVDVFLKILKRKTIREYLKSPPKK